MRILYSGQPLQLIEWKWYDVIELKETRTIRQNNFLHWVVYPQVEKAYKETGTIYWVDTIHGAFKLILLKKKRKYNKLAKRYEITEPTTTTLSKKEFTEYVRAIEEYCMSELNYTLDLSDAKELLYWQSQM